MAPAEPVQYYFTLAQQPGAVQVQSQQQGQTATPTAATLQPGQIIIAQPPQGQVAPVRIGVCAVPRTKTRACALAHQLPKPGLSTRVVSGMFRLPLAVSQMRHYK